MHKLLGLLGLTTILFALSGCDDIENAIRSQLICAAGETDTCLCPDSSRGLKECSSSGGEWGECVCNGEGLRCGGGVEGESTPAKTWYHDADGDGYTNTADTVQACEDPDGVNGMKWLEFPTENDCDDNPETCGNNCHPGKNDTCDGYDNDCNGSTPDGSFSCEHGCNRLTDTPGCFPECNPTVDPCCEPDGTTCEYGCGDDFRCQQCDPQGDCCNSDGTECIHGCHPTTGACFQCDPAENCCNADGTTCAHGCDGADCWPQCDPILGKCCRSDGTRCKQCCNGVCRAWYGDDFSHRIKLTIDRTKVPSSLSNFPVYVDLGTFKSHFFQHVSPTGDDIRVTRADGIFELPLELVSLDPALQQGELHFKADFLSSSADSVFYIYYGNPAASAHPSTATHGAQNVWDRHYKAVWHFAGDPAIQGIRDSSARAHDAASSHVTGDDAGKMGMAHRFRDSHSHGSVAHNPDFDFTGPFTLSTWLYPTDSSRNDIFTKDSHGAADGFSLSILNNSAYFFSGNERKLQSSRPLPTNAWTHLALTWDESSLTFYLNGKSDNMAFPAEKLALDSLAPFVISRNGSMMGFDGLLDEARVSKGVARSGHWIRTEYNNQSSPETFYSSSLDMCVTDGCETDRDGDGYISAECTGGTDCDDSLATGALCYDTCDVFHVDMDGDGHGNPSGEAVSACQAPPGYASGDDCDDDDPAHWAGRPGQCDADCIDLDGDGYGQGCSMGEDCPENRADDDAHEHPGVIWYPDADGDGFGDALSAGNPCERASPTDVSNRSDCNDDPGAQGASCHPGNQLPDVCDTYDNDCDGLTDEEPDIVWYRDGDGDGLTDPKKTALSCEDPDGPEVHWVSAKGEKDCDDGSALCTTSCVDEDQDSIWDCKDRCLDTDRDGYGKGCAKGTDCDDNDADERPGVVWYPDADGDSFGDINSPGHECDRVAPSDVLDNSDCNDNPNDNGAKSFPGNPAPDVCDGVNVDCDSEVDEDPDIPWYHDRDGDGFTNRMDIRLACVDPDGSGKAWVAAATLQDCNDNPGDRGSDCFPGNPAPDICDGYNTDCDGATDEDPDLLWYHDSDADGHTNNQDTRFSCTDPDGDLTYWVAVPTAQDCDDNAYRCGENCHPENPLPDVCDSFDNDCDGVTDEEPEIVWYRDGDSDGFVNLADVQYSCTDPDGLAREWIGTPTEGDCDDDPDRCGIYCAPDSEEPDACDGFDNDCDGATDEDPEHLWYRDRDGDGFTNNEEKEYRCEDPDGSGVHWVSQKTRRDCDDDPGRCGAACFPENDSPDLCDTFDNDCDGEVDENPDLVWYHDRDGDGYTNSQDIQKACVDPDGDQIHWVSELSALNDCDDNPESCGAACYPGNALETCDSYDNDCDPETVDGEDVCTHGCNGSYCYPQCNPETDSCCEYDGINCIIGCESGNCLPECVAFVDVCCEDFGRFCGVGCDGESCYEECDPNSGECCKAEKLLAPDAGPGDKFGYSVALSGDFAIIGAFGRLAEDPTGGCDPKEEVCNTGAAYIFQRTGPNEWDAGFRLEVDDLSVGDNFGLSVAISGQYAAVSAFNQLPEDTSGCNPVEEMCSVGAVYFFMRSDPLLNQWTLVNKVTHPDEKTGTSFGYALAMEGEYAVVGAPSWSDDDLEVAGAAYVFHRIGGEWQFLAEILPEERHKQDTFGAAVDIGQGQIIVGATGVDVNGPYSGAAYIFPQEGARSWGKPAIVVSANPQEGKAFGKTVAIDGDFAVVGSSSETATYDRAGVAYIFKRDENDEWNRLTKIVSPSPEQGAGFGTSVDISGDYVVVGAANDDGPAKDAGAAFVFKRGMLNYWTSGRKIAADDADDMDWFGMGVAIDGEHLIVGAAQEDDAFFSDDDGGSNAGAVYSFNYTNCFPFY